ncbi:hypothetical protein ABCR94_24075 [Streptomyces sp. 21So2-11]
MRHDPFAVDRVAGESAAELVADPSVRHSLAGFAGQLLGPSDPVRA